MDKAGDYKLTPKKFADMAPVTGIFGNTEAV
jgi:hypothetical protein